MMRKTLFLSLLFLPLLLIAQKKDIVVDWGESSQKTLNTLKESNNKDAAYKNRQQSGHLVISKEELYFTHQWKDDTYAIENSVQLSNIRYASLTSEEKRKISIDLVPETITYQLYSSKAREILYTSIMISPVVRKNGVLQKVLSFSMSYKKSTDPRVNLTDVSNPNLRIPLSSSVLASGDWYKFEVGETGVYRISKSFLSSLGMNTDGVNPTTLKVYGNGGKTLPLNNMDNFIFDLPETSIQVIGGEDGSFDNQDYILFYGVGVMGYNRENDSHFNPYSEVSYYYITANGGQGQRIQPMVEPSGNANVMINRYNSYAYHEVDDITPAFVGRQWYGNRFDIASEQSFDFNLPNLIAGEDMHITVKAAAASDSQTFMAVTINETIVNPIGFNAIDDPVLLSDGMYEGDIPAPGGTETVNVNLVYNNNGNPSSIGYLNYISIEAISQLVGNGGQLSFRYNDSATSLGIGQYEVSNASQFSQVWDITNPAFITAKSNEGANNFNFKVNLGGEVREYVAVNPNDYFLPVKGAQTRVVNQDLKGTIFNDSSGNFQDIDYLIITSAFLLQPALRLANHRKNVDGLNIKVVTTDKIYEEFSSGKQDIGAIRNLVKYIYDNASSEANKIKYVGIFGDASVDYKNRLPNNNNIVPNFNRLSSTSTFGSFMSDDFYGLMDPNEGDINNGDRLDIAVGRILADEVGLANAMVDKIVAYESKLSYGNWRNNYVIISDDVDEEFEFEDLETELDQLGDLVSEIKPFINVKKIHSDAFNQETSAGGNRYPEVNEAFKNAIEVGGIVVNYFGHGGEDGLAKEFIFTKQDAEELRNRNRYACFVTVTCEFTKFDNPERITGGELTFWNREGGAVTMITTTRSIGVTLGVEFNKELAIHLFGFGLDTPVTPAEALMKTKNELGNGTNKRVVFYLGDPAMHLAFPKKEIRLTTLNGVPINESTDTLQALSRVRMGGEVVDENGQILSDYNGVLEAKLFDKDVQRQTLGNDGIEDNITEELLILDFKTLGEVLFNGKASVTNGLFEFEFVVPRDIQIPVGKGRLNFYAQRNDVLEDQTGYNLDLNIGGLNEDAPEDNEGPLINLFMNDESFVSGGITDDSPILIAKLEDLNGINTASGIGHDISAIIDANETDPIVLNEYYQAEVDDFTRGVVTFRLRDLAEGLHTLTLKAWDVYNNSSTSEIQFIVAGDNKLTISKILNYPNPFVDYTEFWFNHNRPFEPLEVQVQVFTVTGKVVWTKNQIINTDGFLSREISWDGKDDFGDLIGKGVYIYKLAVKSTLTNQRVEKFEKLVIL